MILEIYIKRELEWPLLTWNVYKLEILAQDSLLKITYFVGVRCSKSTQINKNKSEISQYVDVEDRMKHNGKESLTNKWR